jgi:hypothetical protein
MSEFEEYCDIFKIIDHVSFVIMFGIFVFIKFMRYRKAAEKVEMKKILSGFNSPFETINDEKSKENS